MHNVGTVAACNVAFASRGANLLEDAIQTVPTNLPATAADLPPVTTIDLAPGETIDFAFLLPFNLATNSPVFVGFADTITACKEAVATFVPELVSKVPAEVELDNVVNKLQDKANTAVDSTQESGNTMVDNVQNLDMLKRTHNAPADTTTTTTTPAADAVPTTTTTEEAKAGAVETVGSPEEAAATQEAFKPPPPGRVPVQEPAIASTSAAGTLNYSSMLFLGMIAVASFVALMA